MKFENGKHYKNRGDCCDFIRVLSVVIDTGQRAEVEVEWWTQEHGSYRRFVSHDRFVISSGQYPKWRSYEPRGENKSEVQRDQTSKL